MQVHDLDHTHSLLCFQWSKILPTSKCLSRLKAAYSTRNGTLQCKRRVFICHLPPYSSPPPPHPHQHTHAKKKRERTGLPGVDQHLSIVSNNKKPCALHLEGDNHPPLLCHPLVVLQIVTVNEIQCFCMKTTTVSIFSFTTSYVMIMNQIYNILSVLISVTIATMVKWRLQYSKLKYWHN